MVISWMMIGSALATQAGSISVEWDPVPAADGYRIYYAEGSDPFDPAVYDEVGRVTEATIEGLADCTDYRIAVKAFNAAGESSEYSPVVSGWSRPVLDVTEPIVTIQGSQVTIEFDAANVMTGARLEVDNPNVFVESFSSDGCGVASAALTVEPMAAGVRAAEVGEWSLTVVNPDDVFGERLGALVVEPEPRRFDIARDVGSFTENRIDGQDLARLARKIGQREVDALYDPDLDLNGDGWIDGFDLDYVMNARFGTCWNGNGWSVDACPDSAR